MNIILAPHVSEKAASLADVGNQVVFRVIGDANKAEIAAAVELMFEVEVEGVQVLNVKGKSKNFGRTRGRRKDWKKAYVTLKEGQDIELAAG